MWKPKFPEPHAIPMARLATDDDRVCAVERPRPHSKTADRTTATLLVWFATGASIVWMGVIVMMAVYSLAHAPVEKPREPLANANVVVDVAVPKAPAAPEADPQARPAAAPKLPFRGQHQGKADDLPPPMKIVPEELVLADGNIAINEAQPFGKKIFGAEDFVTCARIGTQVQFMKNPPDTFRRARTEKKLVFMVHLSGNLEDPDFT